MIINFKTPKIIFTIIIGLLTNAAFAQGTTPGSFDSDVVDNTAPTAPINDYVVVALIIAVLMGFYVFRRNYKEKTALNINKNHK